MINDLCWSLPVNGVPVLLHLDNTKMTSIVKKENMQFIHESTTDPVMWTALQSGDPVTCYTQSVGLHDEINLISYSWVMLLISGNYP